MLHSVIDSVTEYVIYTRDNIQKKPLLGDFGLPEKKKEMSFTVYLRKAGRITIPKEVRDALGIEESTLVECRVRRVQSQED